MYRNKKRIFINKGQTTQKGKYCDEN